MCVITNNLIYLFVGGWINGIFTHLSQAKANVQGAYNALVPPKANSLTTP